jgi:integrase
VKGRPGKLGHARAVLGGAIGLAMSHSAIASNPMLGMAIRVPESDSPIVALSPADVHCMREHLIGWAAHRRPTGGPRNPQYLAALLDVMVAAGCRPSEALALRWSEVDLDAGVISITATVIGGAGVPCARKPSPKTKHGFRAIPISAWLVVELMAMRVDARFEMVFPSRNGTYQWPANVGDQWRTAFKGTEWEGIARKAMRSTFATAVGREHGAVAVKESLGHSRESTGERYYIGAAARARDVTDVTDAFGPGSLAAQSEG